MSESQDIYKKVACALAAGALLLFAWLLLSVSGIKDEQNNLAKAVGVGFAELKGQINPIVDDVTRVESHIVRVENRTTDLEKRMLKVEDTRRER